MEFSDLVNVINLLSRVFRFRFFSLFIVWQKFCRIEFCAIKIFKICTHTLLKIIFRIVFGFREISAKMYDIQFHFETTKAIKFKSSFFSMIFLNLTMFSRLLLNAFQLWIDKIIFEKCEKPTIKWSCIWLRMKRMKTLKFVMCRVHMWNWHTYFIECNFNISKYSWILNGTWKISIEMNFSFAFLKWKWN